PGSGKTTISKQLSNDINITHRIGTGFIRESLRAHLSKDDTPALFEYTFRCKMKELRSHDFAQAQIVCKSVNAIIKRAQAEGTSIIIEGSHIVPSLIDVSEKPLIILIDCPDASLKSRLTSNTHAKRIITEEDINNIRELRQILAQDARQNNVPVLLNSCLPETVRAIIGMVGTK
ncbi:MAG: AAA family ATPase, partial [Candidatus Woesearchaeota archaeon]